MMPFIQIESNPRKDKHWSIILKRG